MFICREHRPAFGLHTAHGQDQRCLLVAQVVQRDAVVVKLHAAAVFVVLQPLPFPGRSLGGGFVQGGDQVVGVLDRVLAQGV